MHSPKRRVLLQSAVAALAYPWLARAQEPSDPFPSKPINLMVGFEPGGSTDFLARLIAQHLSQAFGQPVIVQNRPGADGLVAAGLTAHAPPDGYTLHVASMGLTTNPYLYTQNKLDPIKDFSPITLIADVPNILIVNSRVEGNDLKSFLGAAKKKEKTIMMATAGQAAPGALASQLLKLASGAPMQFIAYKGSGPALIDVMSGQVDASMPTVLAAQPGLKSGKLKALAITGNRRSPLTPTVPTFAEAGLPEVSSGVGWYGIVGPAHLPPAVMQKLNAEIVKILHMPDVAKAIENQGATPHPMTTQEMHDFVAGQYAHWGKVIKTAGIQPLS